MSKMDIPQEQAQLVDFLTNIVSTEVTFGKTDYTQKNKAIVRVQFVIDESSVKYYSRPPITVSEFISMAGAWIGLMSIAAWWLTRWQRMVLPFGVANIWDVDDAMLEVSAGHKKTHFFAEKLSQARGSHQEFLEAEKKRKEEEEAENASSGDEDEDSSGSDEDEVNVKGSKVAGKVHPQDAEIEDADKEGRARSKEGSHKQQRPESARSLSRRNSGPLTERERRDRRLDEKVKTAEKRDRERRERESGLGGGESKRGSRASLNSRSGALESRTGNKKHSQEETSVVPTPKKTTVSSKVAAETTPEIDRCEMASETTSI